MRAVMLVFVLMVCWIEPVAAQHWEWISSNNQCDLYVDTDSIRADADENGWFDSAELWYRTMYVSKGALDETWGEIPFPASYDDDALLQGEGRGHAVMNFRTGDVQVDHPSYLDRDGNAIGTGLPFDVNVDCRLFYARLFAFAETQLTGDEALASFDGEHGIVLVTYEKTPKDVMYYNAWRMYRDDSGNVILPVRLLVEKDELDGTMYFAVNFEKQQRKSIAVNALSPADETWHFVRKDGEWKPFHTGENVKRFSVELQEFYEQHPSYINRFHDGKLRLKESLR